MNKKLLKRIMTMERSTALFLMAIILINTASMAFANGTNGSATTAGISNRINCVLCNLADLIFLTAGAIAALVILMGGLRWVTSAEDPGARNAAKTTIISAFVGLIIIMLAVFIVSLVVGNLLGSNAVNPQKWLISGCTTLCSSFAAA